MNNFIEYYSKEIEKCGGVKEYIVAKSIEKRVLLNRIKKYAENKRVLEVGCGSAANSIFLANQGFDITCIDNNERILQFAESNARFFKRKPKFIRLDIKNLKRLNRKFDVSFSHGVLEHYSDKKIIELINTQLCISIFVVVSVPSNFFKPNQAIKGDERFLSKKYWINLISKTNGKLIESFGYFHHSYELKIRFLKIMSILTLNKLPLTKPYIGFVIKKI